MRSVADELKEETRQATLRLSVDEAFAESVRLWEVGLAAFQTAQGVDRETAIRLLERRRQAGRTPSKCMSEIIG